MYKKHSRSLQVRKNRKIFGFKKFILRHCMDSATPPRPNERDPKSRAVKMHRKEEKERRGKRKRKEEKFGNLIAKNKNKNKKKKKTKKKKNKCAHRFFRSDPSAVTFHESNLNGVHYEKACYIYFRLRVRYYRPAA